MLVGLDLKNQNKTKFFPNRNLKRKNISLFIFSEISMYVQTMPTTVIKRRKASATSLILPIEVATVPSCSLSHRDCHSEDRSHVLSTQYSQGAGMWGRDVWISVCVMALQSQGIWLAEK